MSPRAVVPDAHCDPVVVEHLPEPAGRSDAGDEIFGQAEGVEAEPGAQHIGDGRRTGPPHVLHHAGDVAPAEDSGLHHRGVHDGVWGLQAFLRTERGMSGCVSGDVRVAVMVGREGLEPSASSMPWTRSTGIPRALVATRLANRVTKLTLWTLTLVGCSSQNYFVILDKTDENQRTRYYSKNSLYEH